MLHFLIHHAFFLHLRKKLRPFSSIQRYSAVRPSASVYRSAVTAAQVMPCGGGVLNVSDGTLSAGEAKMELTWNELKILQMLLENRGRVVSRESLMTRLWESDAFVDENTLTVNIARLRRKLEAAGLSDYIMTKKGLGYLIE